MRIITLLVLVFSVIPRYNQQGEGEFSYIIGSPNGPERWGFLKPEWAECKDGRLQSPIELPNDSEAQVVGPSEQVFYFYNPANATVNNRGYDVEVAWSEGASKICINNTDYILKQCHFHTPSEHTVGDSRYDMELHMVHENPAPNPIHKYAVVAFPYVIGAPDLFLSKLMGKIGQIEDINQEIPAGVVDPSIPINGKTKEYFRYNGSLTTPPCSETVLWTVDTKVGTVSQEQINLLHRVVRDDAKRNARPLQLRNGRNVVLYKVASPKISSYSVVSSTESVNDELK